MLKKKMKKEIIEAPPRHKMNKMMKSAAVFFSAAVMALGISGTIHQKVQADIVNPGDSMVYYWGNADRTFGWKLGAAWGDLGQDYAASAMIMSPQVATYCIQPNVILHSGSTVSNVNDALKSQAAGWSGLSDATKQQINNVVYASRTLMNGQPSNDYPLYAYTQGWVWNLITGVNGGKAPTQSQWQPDTTALGGVVSTITWSQMQGWGQKIQALVDSYNVTQKGKDASQFIQPSFSGNEYTLIYGQTLKVDNTAKIMGSSTNLTGLKDPATGLGVTGLNFTSTGLNNSVSGSSISFTAQKPVNQTFTVNYTASAKGEAGSTSNNWGDIGLTALVVEMNGGEQNQMVSTAPVTYTTTTEGNPSSLTGSFKVKEIAYIGASFQKTFTHNGQNVANNAVDGIDITQAVYTLFDPSGKPATAAQIGDALKVDNGKQLTTNTFSPDANGKLKLNTLLGGSEGFYLQETTAPDGTDLDNTKYKFDIDGSFNSNPSSMKTDANGTVQTDLTGDNGSHDLIKTFGFKVTKEITMSGKSLADSSNLRKSEFTDETSSYINSEKVDLTQTTYQLQYDDGTAVKENDKGIMAFFDKSDIKAGTEFVASDGSVNFHPDKNGNLEVHDLASLTNKDVKLVETTTPDRTTISKVVLSISTNGTSTSSDYVGEKDDNTHTGAKGFQNDIDYTGIHLIKSENYLGTKDNKGIIGGTSFAGAQYTMFDANTNKPVATDDKCLEKMTMSSDTHLTPVNGTVVFTVDVNGNIANIDNIIYDGFYLLETKAATGMHLDTTKYYFGDADKDAVSTKGTPDTQSAKKESSATSVDDTKLVGDELEKQGRYTQTTSPFGTSKYDPNTNSDDYTAGAVKINDYNSKQEVENNPEIGAAVRSGAVYALFYGTDTNDGTGKKDTLVGNDDPAIAHMQITKGTQIQKDYTTGTGVQIQGSKYFYLATSDDKANDVYGRIGVKDAAYQTYYWKEVQAPAGFQIDHNEYYWGAGYGQQANYLGNSPKDSDDKNVDTAETQTEDNLSTTDTVANYLWDNTFDHGAYGSTDHLLTFGFNSQKMQVNSDSQDQVGENGITITLTPQKGTLGDPISTKTYSKKVPNTNGGFTTIQGYFEFRTVPYGTYEMTSSGKGANNGLLGMDAMTVSFTRDADGNGYSLTFVDNITGAILSQYSSTMSDVTTGGLPNQIFWDTVPNADTSVTTFPNMTGDVAGKDDAYAGYETVAPTEQDTVGKVANENFIGNAGFEVNDNKEPKPQKTIQPHKFDLSKEKVNLTDNTLLNDDKEIATSPAFGLTGEAKDPATAETDETFLQEVANTAKDPKVDNIDNNSKDNLNNKDVVAGQTINYQLWLDTRNFTASDKLTQLGMSDTFDSANLTADASKIKIYDAKGKDVTSNFDVKLNKGTLTVNAKATKDSTDAKGNKVKIVDTSVLTLGQYYKIDFPVIVKDDAEVNKEFVNVATQFVVDNEGNQYSQNTETRQNQLKPKAEKPTISTKANSDGRNTYTPSEKTNFQDKINLDKLTVGDKNTEVIKLWRVPAGNTDKAKVVWSGTKDITVQGTSMEDLAGTVVDTSKDTENGTYYVFTEDLYSTSDTTNGKVNAGAKPLATHDDLTDKDQSVYISTPEVGKTSVKFAIGGIIAGAIVLAGVATYMVITRRKKDEDAA